MSNSRSYAPHYLTIQGSSVPSEHTFSGGGITGAKLQNTVTFAALQILKTGYRNGGLISMDKALSHEPNT
jgi:hypothetical protein